MHDQVALIIGGGIAGPAIALFLKRAGFHTIVFEGAGKVSDIGGGLQIAPNGMQVLRELGLAEPLLLSGVESAEFSFENDRGKVLARIPNGPASRYGLPAIQTGRSLLHELLLQALERERIAIHYAKKLRAVVPDESCVGVEFTDGSSAEGALLIGADGIHSQVRRLLFPEAAPPFYTGLVTVGGFAEAPALAAKEAAHQGRAHMIFGRKGFFGYGYYKRTDPSAVMWWSHRERPDEPRRGDLNGMESDALRERLIEDHREWAQPVPTILQNTQSILCGPVHDVPYLRTWSKGRAVLIGDAAHAISPHAGQGASLALEDAISVAKQLRHSAYPAAFAAYQAERQARVERIASEARKRGEAKQALSPGQAKIRDLVLTGFLRLRGNYLFDEAYRFSATWN